MLVVLKCQPSLHSSSGRTAVSYSARGGSSPSEGSRRCRFCGAEIPSIRDKRANVYCNSKCAADHKSEQVIESWLKGESSGLGSGGLVTGAVKNWLRKTRGDCCELCGWAEVNPVTGKVPVHADHIDGDWRNNRPENLRLICPNCDSLQPTYQALNKGKGRSQRKNPAIDP